ncbi:MAG: hypothetical protein EBX56_02955 [Betaproteobacteria bacterium]|nr:hypothetical protein [Betaproteobacteria bacterium]
MFAWKLILLVILLARFYVIVVLVFKSFRSVIKRSIKLDYANDRERILAAQWEIRLKSFAEQAQQHYEWAISQGIAKEQARALLPEGLTPSRMYMNGTLRSWIFYLKQRLDPSTQKEHRLVAECVLRELRHVAPITISAFFPEE